MAATQKFAPPPIHWAAGRFPAAGRAPVTASAMQRKAVFAAPPIHWAAGRHPTAKRTTTPALATVAQPMKAFTANARAAMHQERAAGDELVGMNGGFRLRSHDRQVLSQPSGVYNFVRVQGITRNQAATIMGAKSPHAALAAGRPVLYAGTAAFEGGNLKWWSNYSGTYQPQAAFNRQAALPEDKFVPWQKMQMGGVGLQRGMLADKRAVTTPDSRKFLARATDLKAGEKAAASPARATAHAGPRPVTTPVGKAKSGTQA